MSEDNVITQNMRDYWLISEVLDASTPTKEAEESGQDRWKWDIITCHPKSIYLDLNPLQFIRNKSTNNIDS